MKAKTKKPKNGKAKALVKAKANGKAVAKADRPSAKWENWKQALVAKFPKASVGELQLHILTMKRMGLDPLSNHGYLLPFFDRNKGEYAHASVVGIDGWRTVAEQGGGYAGKKSVVFDEGVTLYECLKAGRPTPLTCKVIVQRVVGGVLVETVAETTWQSRAQFTKEGDLKPFWKKDPYGMLEKCTEAKALRAACPRLFSDVLIPEEMPGEHEPHNVTPSKKLIAAPTDLPSKPGEAKGPADHGGDPEWKSANAKLHAEAHRLGLNSELLHLYLHQREKVGSLRQMTPTAMKGWAHALAEIQVGSAEYDKVVAKLDDAGAKAAGGAA